MTQKNPQSKLMSIEEQIKKLQEQKKREISKLEKSVGRKFLDMFDCQHLPLNEISSLIDILAESNKNILETNSSTENSSSITNSASQ